MLGAAKAINRNKFLNICFICKIEAGMQEQERREAEWFAI
jgi:hypothetical protein